MGVTAMALPGFTVAVLVPLALSATRLWTVWQRIAVPAAVALPGFLLLHAAVTLTDAVADPAAGVRWLLYAALTAAAFPFWLPVLGNRRRLTDPGRCCYLYLAAPLLDLPALGVIAMGHAEAGLAMIVSMLPIGLAALAVTWRWVTTEERLARTPAVR
jgi:hypothetical protein